jgi:hypothetical protein
MARAGEVLAPGRPDEAAQWIDVLDLARWLVLVARTRVAGVFDGIGPCTTRAEFLAGVAAGVGNDNPELTWVDQAFLLEHEVNPWAGPRSLPLWLPLPEYGGFLTRDVSASLAAGLICRDVADSAQSTLAWLGAQTSKGSGLTAAEETELLNAWHASK